MEDRQLVPVRNKTKNQDDPSDSMVRKQEATKHFLGKDGGPGSELWTDGLLCAFEFVREQRVVSPIKHASRSLPPHRRNGHNQQKQSQSVGPSDLNENDSLHGESTSDVQISEQGPHGDEHGNLHEADLRKISGSHWVPIGWKRISELVQLIHADDNWSAEQMNFIDEESDFTVADVAAPYWERPAGPTWWCHVAAGHVSVNAWLSKAQWLHPAISVALRDESRLISDRMKYLLYEVPVRAAGGLLFELLGQSVGDPFCDEDDIPIVLRSWQAQNFLITALHMKGSASSINVLGITEVQEILFAGGSTAPRSTHEVIAHLACRLSRWDDRLFRKFVFGAADEIELKFVNRRNQEDLNLLSLILNQEIRKLAMQVIRVKWSLHAREEIAFELLQHLRGPTARNLLEGIRKNTREMLEEQEAVRGRLFTIQDVMQSTVRAWLQDRSLRITHNLTVFGGCGLVLSIITGLFGINVDGIPGAENTPYAFGLFSVILSVIGVILIGTGMLYFGLKRPITEERVNVRKMELEQLVSMFQRDAETHAKVRQDVSRHNLPPTAADMIPDSDYILIT